MGSKALSDALLDVLDGRKRQDEKWGEQNHPDEWYYIILMEEAGELAKALLENHFKYPNADPLSVREEAIHTCAVALAMIECMDRRTLEKAGMPKLQEASAR